MRTVISAARLRLILSLAQKAQPIFATEIALFG